MPWCSLPWKRNAFPGQACAASVPHHKKLSPYLCLNLFSFPLLPLLLPLLVYFSGFNLYYRHTPTYKKVVPPPFVYPLLEILIFLYLSRFFVKSEKCVPTNLLAIHESKFSVKHLFFSFFITPHSVLTFCLPRNLLFVYPLTTEIPFLLT